MLVWGSGSGLRLCTVGRAVVPVERAPHAGACTGIWLSMLGMTAACCRPTWLVCTICSLCKAGQASTACRHLPGLYTCLTMCGHGRLCTATCPSQHARASCSASVTARSWCWWPQTWLPEGSTLPMWTWWCTTSCHETTSPSCTGACLAGMPHTVSRAVCLAGPLWGGARARSPQAILSRLAGLESLQHGSPSSRACHAAWTT